MDKVAAIDIGSNAIRMVIGGLDNKRRVQVYRKFREPVRLGQDVFDTEKKIKDDTLEKAIKAFEKFKKEIDSQKIKSTRAVATSAVRDATNGKEFTKILSSQFGINIEIIDGQEEARLIQRAIVEEIPLSHKLVVLLDIGGGSVEITILDNLQVISVDSLKIGTVRLLKKMESENIKNGELYAFILKCLQPFVKNRDLLGNRPVDFIIGTGGNMECLGIIRANYFNKNSTSKIYLEELSKISKKLTQMSLKERIEEWDLRSDRADVIVPASVIAKTVMEVSKCEMALIPRVGLKDGLLLDMLKKST